MNELEREQTIKDYLEEHTFASVKDLSQILDASEATIRRDISKLDEKGLVLKVFGGVAPAIETKNDRIAKPFSENRVRNVEKKLAIAQKAAELCEDGDTIIVHGGTTAYMLAQEIVSKHLKVITNSMPVASLLWRESKIHLVVPGGELHREPELFLGRVEGSKNYYASKSFIGAQAFGVRGIMETNPVLIEGMRHFLDCSDQIIVICDSSKFDLNARVVSCPIDRITKLITDSGITDVMKNALYEMGGEVLISCDP